MLGQQAEELRILIVPAVILAVLTQQAGADHDLHLRLHSNQYTVTVIHFMLHNLRLKPIQGSNVHLHLCILPRKAKSVYS